MGQPAERLRPILTCFFRGRVKCWGTKWALRLLNCAVSFFLQTPALQTNSRVSEQSWGQPSPAVSGASRGPVTRPHPCSSGPGGPTWACVHRLGVQVPGRLENAFRESPPQLGCRRDAVSPADPAALATEAEVPLTPTRLCDCSPRQWPQIQKHGRRSRLTTACPFRDGSFCDWPEVPRPGCGRASLAVPSACPTPAPVA